MLARRGQPVGERTSRLEELYISEGAGASRLAVLLTHDRDAAQDIVQEAFARIARRFFTLRSDDHARAYLYRTVINLAHSRGRQLVRDQALARRAVPLSSSETVDAGERDEMWSRLRSLPVRQRAALFLRYYLDQSETEAADTLDCSLSALKSLVNRGLAALRSELEGGRGE